MSEIIEEEPIYSVTTERLYYRLPEFYRTLDARNGWEFKKYISSIVDQLNDIDVLDARLTYVPPEDRNDWYDAANQYNTYERPAGIENPEFGFAPIYETSDLLDGRTADSAWLSYLAQFIGAKISVLQSEDEKRDAIIRNYLGYLAGSKRSLEESVKRLLTGTKYSRVYPQRDGADENILSPGTQWDVLIITKAVETPEDIDLVAEVIKADAKPAGVILHHIAYNIIWLVLEATFENWAKIEAVRTWSNLETANAENLPLPE